LARFLLPGYFLLSLQQQFSINMNQATVIGREAVTKRGLNPEDIFSDNAKLLFK